MRFYSQQGEDRALYSLFKDQNHGFFVEVGAHDGISNSNTYLFELMGWRGICIEPHKHFYPKLKRNRPNSVCLNFAIWDEDAETCDFHATKMGGWSRIGSPIERPKNHPNPYIEVQHMPLRTLNRVLRENGAPRFFELLSIDVEGTEWHTLRGFDLRYYLPRIVVIEHVHVKKPLTPYFDEASYTPVYWGINTIYCRDRGDVEVVTKSRK
jgi:FkbM family methyltransferase